MTFSDMLIEHQELFGGYLYVTPAGSHGWSLKEMTSQELIDSDEMSAYYESLPEEDYDDGDSDGYGWERAALNNC